MSAKPLLVSAVLGLGIAGAYFAFNRSQQSITNNQTLPAPIIQDTKQPLVESVKLTPTATASAEKTVTQTITETLAKTIADKNPGGPETIDGKQWINALEPDQAVATILAEAEKNFNIDTLRPFIDAKTISVSSDNSRLALNTYAESLNAAFTAGAQKASSVPVATTDNEMLKNFSYLADAYDLTFAQAKKITVPSSFLPLHQKQLGLVGLKANLYRAISDFEKDPVAALMAINALDATETEMNRITESMNQLLTS